MGCLIAANVLIFIYSKKLFFYNDTLVRIKKASLPAFYSREGSMLSCGFRFKCKRSL
jgi:hypothetical protein